MWPANCTLVMREDENQRRQLMCLCHTDEPGACLWKSSFFLLLLPFGVLSSLYHHATHSQWLSNERDPSEQAKTQKFKLHLRALEITSLAGQQLSGANLFMITFLSTSPCFSCLQHLDLNPIHTTFSGARTRRGSCSLLCQPIPTSCKSSITSFSKSLL